MRPKTRRDRFPSGKLRPETASPGMIRTMIDRAKQAASDPLLRTEVGRLRLKDEITSQQAAAAMRYAAIVGAYDRVKGMPRRTLASPSYQSGYGGSQGADREDEEILAALAAGADVTVLARGNDRLKATLRAQKRYEAARLALVGVGSAAMRAVEDVVIYDEIIVAGRWSDLRAGLDALAKHFA